MRIRIKPASASLTKYINNTGNAGQSYQEGINNPRRDWLAATTAAEGTWASSVQAAVRSGSFAKGINQDSAAKQKSNASTLGVGLYPTGTKNPPASWAKLTQADLDP